MDLACGSIGAEEKCSFFTITWDGTIFLRCILLKIVGILLIAHGMGAYKLLTARLHPATVEFGELECCALKKATAEISHSEFIARFLEKVQKTSPSYQVSVLTEIFETTVRLVFIPRKVHCSFYTALALKEKKLLRRQENAALNCGHTTWGHIAALDEIYAKMLCPQGLN